MLRDFICMRFWKRWHYNDREWISGCKTLRVGESVTTKEGSTKKLFEVIEILCILIIVIVQRLSRVQLFVTPWTAAHQASLSFTNSRSLLKLLSVESVMPSSYLLSCPLSSPSPPALNLSRHQGLYQWVGSSHQVAKVLELQHQSFQWIFRTDFL